MNQVKRQNRPHSYPNTPYFRGDYNHYGDNYYSRETNPIIYIDFGFFVVFVILIGIITLAAWAFYELTLLAEQMLRWCYDHRGGLILAASAVIIACGCAIFLILKNRGGNDEEFL